MNHLKQLAGNEKIMWRKRSESSTVCRGFASFLLSIYG